jgi:hypothetical protein
MSDTIEPEHPVDAEAFAKALALLLVDKKVLTESENLKLLTDSALPPDGDSSL